MLLVRLVIETKFGKYFGKSVSLSEENYNKLLKMVKNYYAEGGFELTLEDDSLAVFPPDIVRDSILVVEKVKQQNVQEQI
jgi:hypothetical protein